MVSNTETVLKKIEKNLEKLEKFDSYNEWIYLTSHKFLGEKVLDLGCGIGSITKFFLDKKLVVGTDISKKNIQIIQQRFKTNKNFIAIRFDIEKEDYKKLKNYETDTVFSSNVLEHIKNDELVIQKVYKLLSKNGKLILFVPAHQFLFGSMDKEFHFRRYNKTDLKKKLENNGFALEKLHYVNFPGIFYWYFFGKILKKTGEEGIETAANNKLINLIVKWYSKIEMKIKPPIGLSLFCVAVKK